MKLRLRFGWDFEATSTFRGLQWFLWYFSFDLFSLDRIVVRGCPLSFQCSIKSNWPPKYLDLRTVYMPQPNREMKSDKRTWLFLKETESKRKNDSIFQWPVSTAHRVGAASWKDFGLFLFPRLSSAGKILVKSVSGSGAGAKTQKGDKF